MPHFLILGSFWPLYPTKKVQKKEGDVLGPLKSQRLSTNIFELLKGSETTIFGSILNIWILSFFGDLWQISSLVRSQEFPIVRIIISVSKVTIVFVIVIVLVIVIVFVFCPCLCVIQVIAHLRIAWGGWVGGCRKTLKYGICRECQKNLNIRLKRK